MIRHKEPTSLGERVTAMTKGKKRSAIQRRDFLKAGAAAGAAITFKGSGDILQGAADEKDHRN